MIKLLKNIATFPFRKVAINAGKTRLSPQDNRKRIAQDILFLALLVFTVFIVRFAWIIVTDSSNGVKLRPLAKANYSETTTIYAKRGTIFDREGAAIATDSSDYSIYVILDKTYVSAAGKKLYASSEDFAKVAAIFKEKLGIDESYTRAQLNIPKASQVEFGTKGKHISFTLKEQIEKEAKDKGVAGIGFTSHLARSYTGNFASNFIGLAGLKDGDDDTKGLIGQFGIEASLDNILSGKNGVETLEKNKDGQTLKGIAKSVTPAKDGQDVYTTIDSTLQSYLETLVDTSMQNYTGTEVVATLVKADTGEILATTQRPTFDPSTQTVIGPKDPTLSDKQNLNSQTNLLYQSMFEPGSTFKLFTMAAAIENGTFDPNARYTSTPISVGGTRIADWDVLLNPDGLNMTYPQGFARSSNVGMSKLQMAMGDKVWDSYLNRFRFGIPTRMGVGGEGFGSLPDENIVSQVNSSFGQGVGVTDVQMLRGFSAIANGGTMLEPHFISKIANTDAGTQRISEPEIIGKPVSKTTADSVLKYMVNVGTDNVYGTAYDFSTTQPYFRVAGKDVSIKTGTAQVANPKGGYYVGETAYLYSAVAMVPSVNPDYIFYMTIKLPDHWNLNFISNVANPLLERAYDLKPTIDATSNKSVGKSSNETKIALENYEGKKPGSTLDLLRQQLLQPVVIGSGSVITKQSISPGTKLGANKRILLLTNGKLTMPDIYDWSKQDIDILAKWAGLTVTYDGADNGKATEQSIKMNESIKKGKKLTVTLK
ncbi:penicillin-binding transpeptidase domain-containing protein [Lactococcus paracarnosus]|uniref:PASTA domain-containing protein n=1 Tax=Pseudolactococcus paracarnosus TaxID=2749962 RepID=A0ABT0ALY2_9LACT|nr:penicillin-binding transpeptidase domain-containing protein [Lactococcus paracarnosus]MCJ1977577.1 PASTA domain-containing protein [Lactococcus paracarnosus]MCJ1983720.1 PASTA domain-containing protein [Lactococcus paracarnosus]MCJ1998332.1 PASTA domain-containing protein [Lactococcus paracarnosus]